MSRITRDIPQEEFNRQCVEVGERLRKFRTSRGKNSVQMADSLGVTPRNYHFKESGVALPTTMLLYNLHMKYDADLNWIMCGDEEEKDEQELLQMVKELDNVSKLDLYTFLKMELKEQVLGEYNG